MVKKVTPPVKQQAKTRQEKSARRGFQFINTGSKACKQQATSATDNTAPEPSSAATVATANADITGADLDAPSLKPSASPAPPKPASPTYKSAAPSEKADALVDLTSPAQGSKGAVSMPTAAATDQATGPSRDGPAAAVKAAAHPLTASDASARPVVVTKGVLDGASSLAGKMSRSDAEGLRCLPQAEVANVIEHLVQTLSPDSPLEEMPATVLPAANGNSRTSLTGPHPPVKSIKQTGQAGSQHQAPALSFRDITFSQQDHEAAANADAGSDASQHRLSPAGVDTPHLAQPDKLHSTNTATPPFDNNPCGSYTHPAPAHLQEFTTAPSATAQQPLSGAANPLVPGLPVATASKVSVPMGGATAEQTAGPHAAGSLAGGDAEPSTTAADASAKVQGQQGHLRGQSRGITKPQRPTQRRPSGKGLSKEAKAEAKRAEQTKNAMALLERLNSKRKPKADQPAAPPQGTAPTDPSLTGLQASAEPSQAGGVQEPEQAVAPSCDVASQPANGTDMDRNGESAKPLPEVATEAATATKVPSTQVHRGGAQAQSRSITKPKRPAPRRTASKGLSKEAKAEAKRAEQNRAAMALLERVQLKNKAKEERFAVSRQGKDIGTSSSAQQALAAPSSAAATHTPEPAIVLSHDSAQQAGPGGAMDHPPGKAAVPAPSLVARSAAMSRLPPTQASLNSKAEPQQRLQAHQLGKPSTSKPATAAAHRGRHHSSVATARAAAAASGQRSASTAEERAAKALRQEELIKLMRRNSASDAAKLAAILEVPSTDKVSEAEAHTLAPAGPSAEQDPIGKHSDARPNKATGGAQIPAIAPGASTNQAPQTKGQLDHQLAARAPLASAATGKAPHAMQQKSSQPVAAAAAAAGVKAHTPKPSPAKVPKAAPAQCHRADPMQLHKAAPAQAPRASPAKVPKATPAQPRRLSPVRVSKAGPAQANIAPGLGAESAQIAASAQAAVPHASATHTSVPKAEAAVSKTLPSGSTATGQADPPPAGARPAASGAPRQGQAAFGGAQSQPVADPEPVGSSQDGNDSSDGAVEAVWKAVGVLTGVLGNGQETEESTLQQLGNRPDAQQPSNAAPNMSQDASAAAARRDVKKKRRSRSLGAETELPKKKKKKKNKDTAEAQEAVNQSPDLEHAEPEADQQQPAASGASAVVQSMLGGSNADPDDAIQADIASVDKTQSMPQQDALAQEASAAAASRDGKKKKRSRPSGAETELPKKRKKKSRDTAEAQQAVDQSPDLEHAEPAEAAQQQPAASGASAVVQSMLGGSNPDSDDASQADVASVDKTQPPSQQAATGEGQVPTVDQDSADEPVHDQAANASQQSNHEAVHMAGSTRQAARANKKKGSRAERRAGRAAIRAARDTRKAAREAAKADERLQESARIAVALALQEAAALQAVPTGGHKTLRVKTGRERAQNAGNSIARTAASAAVQQSEEGPSAPMSGQEVAKEGLSVKHQEHAGVGVQKHVKQKASGGNTAEDAVQQKPADSKMKKRKPSEDEEASTSNAERAVKQRSHKKKTKKRRTGGEKEARAIEKEAAGGASPAGAAEQGAAARIAPSPFAAQLMEGRLNEVVSTYLASSGTQAQQAAQSQLSKNKHKHRKTSQRPGLTQDEVQARMDNWFGRIPAELYKVQQAAKNNKSPDFYGAAAFMAEWLQTQLPAVLFSTQA